MRSLRNPNSHMHRKPRFKTGLNYDFDLPGEKIALFYQQATRNGTKHTNSMINGALFAA